MGLALTTQDPDQRKKITDVQNNRAYVPDEGPSRSVEVDQPEFEDDQLAKRFNTVDFRDSFPSTLCSCTMNIQGGLSLMYPHETITKHEVSLHDQITNHSTELQCL